MLLKKNLLGKKIHNDMYPHMQLKYSIPYADHRRQKNVYDMKYVIKV